jgi:MFS family permease
MKLYTSKFWLLCLSSFFFFSSFNMMIPELPDYLSSLGGEAHKGLIIPLFTLMAGLSRPFSGRLTDTIGRVPVLIYGAVVCIVAGLLYPLVTTVFAFFLLRLVHGMSTGFKPTATMAYAGDIAPIERRGEAMGIQGMFGSLGMAAGPAIGGWLAIHTGFDAMFYMSSAFALLSVLVVLRMPETLIVRQRFHWKLLRIGRADIFDRRALPSSIVMFLTAFSSGTVLTLIPDFSNHLGIANKGMFFTVFTLSSILMRFISGRVSDRYGRVPVLLAGTLIYVFTMTGAGFAGTVEVFFAVALAFGAAIGLTSPAIFAWTVDLADEKYRGRALATMFIALEAGIGVGGVFSGYSYGNNPANFPLAFIVSGVLALFAFLYLLYYRNVMKRRVSPLA